LRFLVKSQAQLNGREIAKNVGLSHVKTHTALKDLTMQGVVNMRSVGRALIYWLNEELFLVKDIIRPAFEREGAAFREVSNIILSKIRPLRPLSIILFGSFTKGSASAYSDIDIVIVYPNNKNKETMANDLIEAEKSITLLFGNHLASTALKVEEFQKKLKTKDRFINEVIQTGKVIYGRDIPELINLR
jgi:predicted nucleotidyltransferase